MNVSINPQEPHALRLAVRQGLLPARGSGLLAGFGNMLAKGMGEWFHTRRWIAQLIIWPVVINGFVTFVLFVLPLLAVVVPGLKSVQEGLLMGFPPEVLGFMEYFNFAMLAGTIGAIIFVQDEIIQEKQLGTAAWILSKPTSRSAFILTKLLANAIGMLVFVIAVPGLITLGENYLASGWVPSLIPLLAAAGVVMLGLFFYLSLVIMLGVLFESRSPVLGIAFVVMFTGMVFTSFFPQLAYVLPAKMEGIAAVVMTGMPMPAMFVSELISTAVLSIGFTLVALWRFHQREF